jgi:hypothetical protein
LGVNLGLTLGGLFMGVVIGEIGLRAAKIEGYPKIGDLVDSAPTLSTLPIRIWAGS